MKNVFFLPAVGYRLQDAVAYHLGTTGYYWSSTQETSASGKFLWFSGSTSDPVWVGGHHKGIAMSIRCVR